MQLSDFDFAFDNTLIATHPVSPRHGSKMLCVKNGDISHHHTIDFVDFLNENDCIVMNNTKVLKARLNGYVLTQGRSAKFEMTLHKFISNDAHNVTYSTFIMNSRRLNIDDIVRFDYDKNTFIMAYIKHKDIDTGEVIVQFNTSLDNLYAFLDIAGMMPLPPYIASKRAVNVDDDDTYQSIFAQHLGSVAAPTASLHFDDILMQKIKDKNIKTAFVTLHVGGGTFLPVKTYNINDHKMHSEMMSIDRQNADIINQTKASGGRIIAIGTTALRCLESAADKKGIVQAVTKDTDIFITPSYQFKMVDILLTNFHLPKSTLFMLVCALCGTKTMHDAYAAAQEQKYRFFSYGDSCLLFKAK